mmetsp:Transcript_35587/g.83167  ORF Transcript_35587/g.83167 Transcript_35587/m.83167 type:complete len:210 (-) Transcript_35587:2598-3227(-)
MLEDIAESLSASSIHLSNPILANLQRIAVTATEAMAKHQRSDCACQESLHCQVGPDPYCTTCGRAGLIKNVFDNVLVLGRDLKPKGNHEQYHHEAINERPLAECVQDEEHLLSDAGWQDLTGCKPAKHHCNELGVWPDTTEEHDKNTQGINPCVPHLDHAAHQGEVLHRRKFHNVTTIRHDAQHNAYAITTVRRDEDEDRCQQQNRQGH